MITLKVIPWLKSKTTKEQQDYLLATTRVLVYAAEQVYGAGKGDVKMQYVQDELENRGLTIDMPVIEATVREMNLIESWETTIELEETEDGKH